MELYQHQKEFLRQNSDKSALVWSCGTGKTRTAIEWAKLNNNYTLIICPKSLKTNWIREINKWGLKSWCVITKEEFRRDYNKDNISGLGNSNQIIVDEVHNGFLTPHFKSQMSKSLRDYIKQNHVERVLLLSATVYTSSPWNIYQLAILLGHKWNWQDFNFKFFNQVWMGPRIIPVPKKGVEVQLAELTKKIASIVDIKDVIDVPLQFHCDPEYFSLNGKQKKEIKWHYDPVPIVRFTKQHQIENGILIGHEFLRDQIFNCDKNEKIMALVRENPKIVFVMRYNLQIDAIYNIIKSYNKDNPNLKEKYNPYIIRGDVSDRDRICREAESAEKAVVLIQADCGIGFELPSFPVCVYVSMSYSYTAWEQMNGRFLRVNKPSKTTFIYLLTEGNSVDQGIYDAIKQKEDFKIELFKK